MTIFQAHIPHDPIILLPHSYPREILIHMCRRHIAQDIHCDTVNKSKEIGNNLNKYPSVQKQLNKLWYIHPHNRILYSSLNGTSSFFLRKKNADLYIAIWKNIKDILLNQKLLLKNIQMKKEMATHSSILAWKSPWTEEPGGLQFMGLHD